ncbi:hypothetical protein QKW60_17300 [Defluviimonas aestuarii]|uniref:hypothetical protein n=1 Tax=Albidovulum aestuarii TaxID=1130726 RepID=UPI00249C7135|nr:hypothetical protein [Defluviimonas aestuarii]MDI3338168.1 hypothetical protein [Defluviimonas aestuarii]
MRVLVGVMVALGFLTACTQPRANIGARATPDGVKVTPSISTSIAGIGLTVTP